MRKRHSAGARARREGYPATFTTSFASALAGCFSVGWNPFVCVPIAGLVAALVAIPTSKIVFRLRGGYFAIGTWVVAESFRLVAANLAIVGGGTGTSLTSMRDFPKALREPLTFWIALVVAVGAVAGVYWLLRSRHGLALTAIRDSERAAASQGVDIAATKFWVYLIAAFGCGVVGALYFLMNLRVSPDAAFGVSWTAFVIFIVVIGGIGTIEGPIIGTLVFFALREALADFGTGYLIALGVVAVVVMVRFPRGLWGYVAARFDLHLTRTRASRASTATPAGTSSSSRTRARPVTSARAASRSACSCTASGWSRTSSRPWRTGSTCSRCRGSCGRSSAGTECG